MAAPQGSDFQIGYGWETLGENIAGTISHFFRPQSAAGLKPKRTSEEPGNLDPSGQALRKQRVKADVAPSFVSQPDVDSVVRKLAHLAGNYKVTALVTAPSAPTVALAGLGAGNLDTSVDYFYKVTFVTSAGETEAGTASSAVQPTGGDGQVAVSAIPVGPTGVTARKLYRTEGGGSTYKLLATISDNTTTTYADNVADGSLGANAPSTNTAGAQSWDIRPDAFSGSSVAPSSATFEADFGDGYPIVVTGNRLTETVWQIAENKLVGMTEKWVGCYDTYCDDAVEVNLAGSYDQVPRIRGHRSDPTSTDEIKVKVTTTGALDGTAKVKFTKGATAYGSTEYAVTAGQWMRVVLADGSLPGHSRSETLWVLFPTSAQDLTQDDEWKFENVRTAATASYSSLNPLNAAGVEITIDGDTYYVHTCNVTIQTPWTPSFRVGSYYAEKVQPNGKKRIMVDIGRDYDDRELLLKLISAESIAVSVKLYGDPLASSIYDELVQIDIANATADEQDSDVANENALQESVKISGYRSGSTSLYTITCQGSVYTI